MRSRSGTAFARLGWQVTAADLSAVAVERLSALARSHGLGDHVTTVRADAPRRIATGPDGRTAEVTDHVLLRRTL